MWLAKLLTVGGRNSFKWPHSLRSCSLQLGGVTPFSLGHLESKQYPHPPKTMINNGCPGFVV